MPATHHKLINHQASLLAPGTGGNPGPSRIVVHWLTVTTSVTSGNSAVFEIRMRRGSVLGTVLWESLEDLSATVIDVKQTHHYTFPEGQIFDTQPDPGGAVEGDGGLHFSFVAVGTGAAYGLCTVGYSFI